MKIYAIIPTYNQKRDVKEAVESLLRQTKRVDRIIVVDNASIDGTSKYLKNNIHDKRFYFVSNPQNLGVTGGRNKGLDYINDADYILFFDHDMVAKPEMVENLLVTMEKRKNTGIVTAKIYFNDDKNIIWSAGTDVNLLTGQTLFRGGKDIGQFNKEEEVAVAPAVLLVKSEVIHRIGKFDPIYFATYEDTDFCFRAKKAGFVTFYTPKAIAYHKIPLDPDLSNRRLLGRAYWIARNRIIFMKRFGKSFLFFLFISPIFMVYYLILSLKYRQYSSVLAYLKGSIDGFFFS